jgi:hypothetical protein
MSNIFIFDHEEESSSKINIDDLYEKRKRSELKQISIFNKILSRIHKRIQHIARTKKTDTNIWFVVPEYIVGEPVYDKGECIGYLVSQLENNGFHVKYIHPNTLFVSWHNWVPTYVRQELKKKMGVILDERGNILEKKNSEEDNVNAETQLSNGNSSQKLQKQYNSTKDYKPTGNLVYSPDILEKLEKKISLGNPG